nr:MAG TPA: hypothetical protein [Bacteriophage sp.]
MKKSFKRCIIKTNKASSKTEALFTYWYYQYKHFTHY